MTSKVDTGIMRKRQKLHGERSQKGVNPALWLAGVLMNRQLCIAARSNHRPSAFGATPARPPGRGLNKHYDQSTEDSGASGTHGREVPARKRDRGVTARYSLSEATSSVHACQSDFVSGAELQRPPARFARVQRC